MPAKDHMSQNQFATYYHGTGHHNVESIKEKGLIPNRPGEDMGFEDADHPWGVYMTQNLDEAREFGPAVFAVDLSREEERNMNYSYSNSHNAYPGVVPPHRLRLVEE